MKYSNLLDLKIKKTKNKHDFVIKNTSHRPRLQFDKIKTIISIMHESNPQT